MDALYGFGKLQPKAKMQQRALQYSVYINALIRYEHNASNRELQQAAPNVHRSKHCLVIVEVFVKRKPRHHGFKMGCSTQTRSFTELNFTFKYLYSRVNS